MTIQTFLVIKKKDFPHPASLKTRVLTTRKTPTKLQLSLRGKTTQKQNVCHHKRLSLPAEREQGEYLRMQTTHTLSPAVKHRAGVQTWVTHLL